MSIALNNIPRIGFLDLLKTIIIWRQYIADILFIIIIIAEGPLKNCSENL